MSALGHHRIPDDELELEVRALLRRHSHDVDPNLPTWPDLIRDQGAVVVSLRTGQPLHARPKRLRRHPGWIRPMLAAAACLAVAMAAGVVIGRSGSGSHSNRSDHADGTAAQQNEASPQVAVGDDSFDPATAAVVFPATDETTLREEVAARGPGALQGMGSPEDATRTYLSSIGMDASNDDVIWTEVKEETRKTSTGANGEAVETIRVWWSVRDPWTIDPSNDLPLKISIGYVELRNLVEDLVEGPGDEAWVVVGAQTTGLALTDLSRSGDDATFTVLVLPDNFVNLTSPQVVARVNDEQVLNEALTGSRAATLSGRPGADQTVRIRALITQEGGVVGITESALAPATEVPPVSPPRTGLPSPDSTNTVVPTTTVP